MILTPVIAHRDKKTAIMNRKEVDAEVDGPYQSCLVFQLALFNEAIENIMSAKYTLIAIFKQNFD